MPRSDLLLSLVKAAVRGDQANLTKVVEAVIADERRKQHHVLADRLGEYLRPNGQSKFTSQQITRPEDRTQSLFFERTPTRTFEDLFLPNVLVTACFELVEEQHRRDLLRAHGLEPRNRVLLSGPPGNGKTSVAEAIANSLGIPLITVRYEGVIGSYLGETSTRLRQLFEYVHTRDCVLFFDEFDTIGKERGDVHETGEIKRVVSSLLLQIDALPSHVVVVTATNHAELLDRAVWRRFQLRLDVPKPTRKQIELWFERFSESFDEPLGYSPGTLADKLFGLSFSEVEEFGADILRRYILSLSQSNLTSIVRDRIVQLKARVPAPNA